VITIPRVISLALLSSFSGIIVSYPYVQAAADSHPISDDSQLYQHTQQMRVYQDE